MKDYEVKNIKKKGGSFYGEVEGKVIKLKVYGSSNPFKLTECKGPVSFEANLQKGMLGNTLMIQWPSREYGGTFDPKDVPLHLDWNPTTLTDKELKNSNAFE